MSEQLNLRQKAVLCEWGRSKGGAAVVRLLSGPRRSPLSMNSSFWSPGAIWRAGAVCLPRRVLKCSAFRCLLTGSGPRNAVCERLLLCYRRRRQSSSQSCFLAKRFPFGFIIFHCGRLALLSQQDYQPRSSRFDPAMSAAYM